MTKKIAVPNLGNDFKTNPDNARTTLWILLYGMEHNEFFVLPGGRWNNCDVTSRLSVNPEIKPGPWLYQDGKLKGQPVIAGDYRLSRNSRVIQANDFNVYARKIGKQAERGPSTLNLWWVLLSELFNMWFPGETPKCAAPIVGKYGTWIEDAVAASGEIGSQIEDGAFDWPRHVFIRDELSIDE